MGKRLFRRNPGQDDHWIIEGDVGVQEFIVNFFALTCKKNSSQIRSGEKHVFSPTKSSFGSPPLPIPCYSCVAAHPAYNRLGRISYPRVPWVLVTNRRLIGRPRPPALVAVPAQLRPESANTPSQASHAASIQAGVNSSKSGRLSS